MRIYAQAYRITGTPLYKSVVDETAGYLLREMFHSDGGFYSTQDADSECEEGKFFVWTEAEVMELLGEDAGAMFCRIYDVTEGGNFEEKNILHPILTFEQASQYFHKEYSEIAQLIVAAKQRLFSEREKRIKPFRDEKIITAWNGLVLSGLAEAIKIAPHPSYVAAASRTIDFIFAKLFRDGYLLHSYKDGRAKQLGFLDDYAFMINGLLDIYEALFDHSDLERAITLGEIMLREFWDEKAEGFFSTGHAHEKLISRAKPVFDGSIPSGNAIATQALLRMHYITGEKRYGQYGEQVLRSYYDAMVSQPFGFAHLLCTLDFYLEKPKEVVVVGEREDPRVEELRVKMFSVYQPNMTIQLASPHEPLKNVPPVLRGKSQVGGKPTVYVCHNLTCSMPAISWDELKPLIDR